MDRTDRTLLGLLYLVSCIGQTSIIILNLALVFFARNTLNLDPGYIGFFAAAANVTYCFGLIVLSRFSASLKPRHASLIASSAMALIPVCIVLFSDILSAFILYGLYGLLMSLFWPPIMGWISRGREKKELGKRMGEFNVSWSIGVLAGPYLGGILSEFSPSHGILAAAGAAAAVTLLMFFSSRVLPEITNVQSRKVLSTMSSEQDSSTPLRFLTWTGLFTGYAIFGITMNIFPLFAQDVLLYSESRIGMLLLFRGVTATLCFYLLGKTHYWHHNTPVILLFQAAAVVLCLFAAAAESLIMIALFMLLFGICFAHLYSFSIFHGASGSINREQRMAVHETVLTIGIFTGSAAGGMLYGFYGFSTAMTAAAVAGAAGLLVQLALLLTVCRCRSSEKSL